MGAENRPARGRGWIALKSDFTVSVNISALQMMEKHFLRDLTEIVRTEDFPCENLILELTESCTVQNLNIFESAFKQMRAMGIRVAMDDFGTGYSSLEILKRTPVDIVKIDRGFVKGILNSRFDATFISFVVAICHEANIRGVPGGRGGSGGGRVPQGHASGLHSGLLLWPPARGGRDYRAAGGSGNTMKKGKRIALCAAGLLVLLTAALAVYLFWFTPTGYRMSVPIHGFSKVGERTYVDRGWTGDTQQLLSQIAEAQERVRGFFGEVRSAPVLIVCDDPAKIGRLGGDHDTMTVVLGGVRSYTAVSSEFLNVDVLAHEMTHAETHWRLYAGGRSSEARVPVWFDEGLAVQNDYREPYTEAAWLALTDGGGTCRSFPNTAAPRPSFQERRTTGGPDTASPGTRCPRLSNETAGRGCFRCWTRSRRGRTLTRCSLAADPCAA